MFEALRKLIPDCITLLLKPLGLLEENECLFSCYLRDPRRKRKDPGIFIPLVEISDIAFKIDSYREFQHFFPKLLHILCNSCRFLSLENFSEFFLLLCPLCTYPLYALTQFIIGKDQLSRRVDGNFVKIFH